MNERIEQFAIECYQAPEFDYKKFAESIVQECINVVEQTPTHCAFTTYDYPTVICTISKSVEFLKTEFGLPK